MRRSIDPAYTSFENSDMTRSGWTIGGTAIYNYNVPSPTGNNTLTLLSSGGTSLTTTASLNTGAAYVLSFWASNSNVTVTGGATLTKSAPAYNGFTYYEYNIAAGTTSVVLKIILPRMSASMRSGFIHPIRNCIR